MLQQSEYFSMPTDDEGLGAAINPALPKPPNPQQAQMMAIEASAAQLQRTQTYVVMGAAVLLAGVIAYSMLKKA